jgi:Mrp family chromosome partitioning ATPase
VNSSPTDTPQSSWLQTNVDQSVPTADFAEALVHHHAGIAVEEVVSDKRIFPRAAERIVEGALSNDENTRAYEQLATRVAEDVCCFPTACVGFISANQGGDSTFVTTILANIICRQQKRVLLLDCDREQRCLTMLHGAVDRPGTCDILRGSARIPDSVLLTRHNVEVLPIGTNYQNAEWLPSKTWGQFLSQIKVQSPLTLLDLGTMQSAFSTQVAQLCETVYLVVALGRTPRYVYTELTSRIPLQGIRLRGTIVTL